MTQTQTQTQTQTLKTGDRVRGGHGEDRDYGVIHHLDGDRAFVGWQSGVSTWTPIEDLEPAE